MKNKIIDSHIHLDAYSETERDYLVNSFDDHYIQSVVSVSNDYNSALTNLALAKKYEQVKIAIGYHPEQTLPDEAHLLRLQRLIREHKDKIVAIGEVGLPYYLRKKESHIPLEPYTHLLEWFIIEAKRVQKPIVLHAIYDDAKIAIRLLEKHSIHRAQFHWFKGDHQIVDWIINNGYTISFTPDICYEEETRNVVTRVPLQSMMVETDGPWPFHGSFAGKMTEPNMLHEVIKEIANIKNVRLHSVYKQILENTQCFFNLT